MAKTQIAKMKVKRKISEIDDSDKRIVVYQHLGLGDHFICFGLIREISKLTVDLYLVCKRSNIASLTRLYAHLSNVYLISLPKIETYEEEKQSVLLLASQANACLFLVGHSNEVSSKSFDIDFYRLAGVHESERYASIPQISHLIGLSDINRAKFLSGRPFLLVHREASYGFLPVVFQKSNYDVIEVNKELGDNILKWLQFAEKAEEIHCVPSSFFCMMDLFSRQLNAKLYLHDIRLDFALDPNNQYNRYRWNVISYVEKL